MEEKTTEEKRTDLTAYPINDSVSVVPWRGKTLHIRPLIGIEETAAVIRTVLSACYDKESDMVIPEMLDFVFRVCVICSYTNADIPEPVEERYKFVYLTDLYDTVLKKASSAQIEAMRNTVEALVYRR